MEKQLHSISTVKGDGIKTLYPVPFKYISKDHIKVTINGIENKSFSWHTDQCIQFNTAPSAGSTIVISRHSAEDTNLVTYTTGTTLTKTILQKDSDQKQYLIQEALDDSHNSLRLDSETYTYWNAKDKQIKTVKDPTENSDATTKNYVDEQIVTRIAHIGSGNVTGPANSTDNSLAAWSNTNGTQIKNTNIQSDTVVTAPSKQSETGQIPKFSDTTGTHIENSSIKENEIVSTSHTPAFANYVVVSAAPGEKKIKYLATPDQHNYVLVTQRIPNVRTLLRNHTEARLQWKSLTISNFRTLDIISSETKLTLDLSSNRLPFIFYEFIFQELRTRNINGAVLCHEIYDLNNNLLTVSHRSSWFNQTQEDEQTSAPQLTRENAKYKPWEPDIPLFGRMKYFVPSTLPNAKGLSYEGLMMSRSNDNPTNTLHTLMSSGFHPTANGIGKIVFIDENNPGENPALGFESGTIHILGTSR